MMDDRRAAIRRAFERLADENERWADREAAGEDLVRTATPDEFAEIALDACGKYPSESEYFAARGIFERFGQPGWKALRRLIGHRPEDAVAFLLIVQRFEGVSIAEKLGVMAEWTARLDPETVQSEFSWVEG